MYIGIKKISYTNILVQNKKDYTNFFFTLENFLAAFHAFILLWVYKRIFIHVYWYK